MKSLVSLQNSVFRKNKTLRYASSSRTYNHQRWHQWTNETTKFSVHWTRPTKRLWIHCCPMPKVRVNKRDTFEAVTNGNIRPLLLQVSPLFPADTRQHERRSTSLTCGGKLRGRPHTPYFGSIFPQCTASTIQQTLRGRERSFIVFGNTLRNPRRQTWNTLASVAFCCYCIDPMVSMKMVTLGVRSIGFISRKNFRPVTSSINTTRSSTKTKTNSTTRGGKIKRKIGK